MSLEISSFKLSSYAIFERCFSSPPLYLIQSIAKCIPSIVDTMPECYLLKQQ